MSNPGAGAAPSAGPSQLSQADGLCRDCMAAGAGGRDRCPLCGSHRWVRHPELHQLGIAHIDCDAFYASVEKRDNPDLRDRPLIIGGGNRGVVCTCCYIARLYGVRSAMPMFQAVRLCPEAVVLPPDIRRYRAVARQIRSLMRQATPIIEPLSLDEAYLDLTDAEDRHSLSPARVLALLVKRIETDLGLTVSAGLSGNKFLAKIASDLDKPRGFAVIGMAEAPAFLAPRPVSLIWGVGAATERRLRADGIHTIGDLLGRDESSLRRRYGAAMARHLYRFARGDDDREVEPDAPARSISAETTFLYDVSDPAELARRLRPLCQTVIRRLEAAGLSGRLVVLKLKGGDFQQRTRSHHPRQPLAGPEDLWQEGCRLLEPEADGRAFRLIGIGVGDLRPQAMSTPDLFAPDLFARS